MKPSLRIFSFRFLSCDSKEAEIRPVYLMQSHSLTFMGINMSRESS